MQQQSLGLKSQSTAFIPRTRGSIIVVCTPGSTHPCVFAAARLSRPYCTRPPSKDLGGLFALRIRDALLISAYYILILCRSSNDSGGSGRRSTVRPTADFRTHNRGGTRTDHHANVLTRTCAGADMPGSASGGDATEQSPRSNSSKTFSPFALKFSQQVLLASRYQGRRLRNSPLGCNLHVIQC